MTDIVERLRSVDISWSETGELCAEAAEALTAKDAEIARLREALERIRDYAPEVTHGWALAIRTFARQALTRIKEATDATPNI